MSAACVARRRRRQYAMGFKHLARICGKSVRGGRPIYAGRSTRSVHESIAREKAIAARQASIKRKSKG